MILKIYKPEVFQGNLKKKNYFEGWFFKHVSGNKEHVWSFIPGISLNGSGSHAFIQVINGITGESDYISYPVGSFEWKPNRLWLKVGDSVFTDEFSDIRIDGDKFSIHGKLLYENIVKYPSRLFSPGIMGWYSFVPQMECNHGVLSVNHRVKGVLSVNNKLIDFAGGKGYTEKDWGTSFPESFIWIQANNFRNPDTSLFFSVAKIPWRGKFFLGFIAFLYFEGDFFLYSSYNNSRLKSVTRSGNSIDIVLRNKVSILRITSRLNTSGELVAPESGSMSRKIRDSNDSEVTVSLLDFNDCLLCNDTSVHAGIEVIERIFDYL